MKKYTRLFVALAIGCSAINLSAQDSSPPTIQAASPSAGTTVGSLLQVTVTFSEPVANVAASDLLANGIPAIALSGSGATYTFVLEEEPTLGLVQITWDPSHDIRDLSPAANRFNENGPTATWQYTLFDGTVPTVAALEPAPGVGVRSLTQVEVTFSEAVVGVEAGDLLINATPATGLQILGVGRYRFIFAQPASGSIQVQWAGNHQIRDLAVVPNGFGGGSWSYQLDPSFGVPAIRINEFVSGNVSGLLDENGEAQDWIEIWNYGSVDVNLAGYSLTDDVDDPGRWTFPSTNLAPGQFLVVFASGKDRKSPATSALRMHTNFRLGTESEYLGLYNAESPRVVVSDFAPEYPTQRNNTSYGPDDSGQLKYFAAPTPGAPNGQSAISAALVPPHFNVERGTFENPFQLILTHPIYGVSIRYTTDGSEPALNNGQVYFAPVTISNSTPVRAAAFKSGFLPSTTVTHTYLFPAQTIRQPNNPAGYPTGPTVMGGYPADYEMDPEIVNNAAYASSMVAALRALPAVSMVTSVDNMFGATNGIYTHISEDQALFRGEAWERACSIEFLPNDGSTGFQINCGVRMQGNASRNPQKTPKHPFRLLFKNDYGPGRLDAKVFPDSPVQSFNTLVMRADFNNSWLHWSNAQRDRGTRIRDAWAKDTWRAMGQPGSHSRYFHLYINGIYWGIYDFGERIDATMAANYLGGEPEDYDAVASKPVKALDGDLVAFNAMSAAVKSRPLTTLSNYQAVLELLDVDNFADYMILNFYGANQDWGNDSNWNAIRRRNPSGKFQFVSWDGEQLIVSVSDNRVSNTDVPAGLHTSLVNSPEYRLAFADRAHKHFFNGGALSTNAVAARWSARAAEVSTAIIAETARWGDYRRDVHQYQTGPYILYTRDLGTTNWLAEINRLLTSYFPQRGDIFLNQLRAAGLYPTVDAPTFNRQGGVVARGFSLTMSAANPIYYTLDGSDPRMFGTGAVSPTASLYAGAITLNSSATVKARALLGTNWSALNAASFSIQILNSPLRITEIMYNPIGGDAYEYLELQNIGASLLDVSGQTIDAIAYAFPPNTILQPGQVIVLGSATSPGNWNTRYPGVTVLGRFTGKLDNAGEKLAIADGSGATLWSVDYDDENGWPREADGGGFSLEIIDPLGDPDNPANWRASASQNGTPGSVSPAPPAGVVTINEIMADNPSAVQNAGTYPDWVELRNGGGSTVNLGGWSLTDDSNPRKFVFPAGASIAAGGFLVVWCDTNSAAPGMHSQFALSRDGDSVFLFDANTNRVDAVGFGLQLSNQSIGRVATGWALTQPTPAAANVARVLSPSSNLSINEWLANSVPGGADWIELYNRAADPVALGGVYLAVGGSIQSLAPLSFIGAQGYVQLLADENPGAKHLDFKLPAAGATIVLSSEAGVELERITYGSQAQGVSQGRLPDGASNFSSFPTSQSPEAPNYVQNYNGPLLNEVLAINRSAVSNAMGRAADFVELYNAGAAPYDVSGLRLSNDPENAAQWYFPTSTVIPANGYLVVWFDEEQPATTTAGALLNTGHSLDGESGEVWLFNGAGQPVDSVVFGFQIADLSIVRAVGGSWNLASAPTPGTANASPTLLGSSSGLRINEWVANSPSGDDWFEIYNSGTQAVNLQGLMVSDHPQADSTPFNLPALSYIGAKGFVRLKADGNPSNGRNHVNFSLDGEGESLWLSSATLGMIDSVSFGTQPAGIAEGRLPDGTGRIVSLPVSATPGESNYEPWRDVVISEVIPRGSISAENGIELRNVTGAPVSLDGWYLSDSQGEFKKFRIPDGTVIPANGHALFLQSQFAGAGAAIPFALDGNRSGEVWLSETAGAALTGRRVRALSDVADPGMTFGRYSTTFGVEFPPTQQGTPGTPNTLPRLGPVVINEVMYHPPALAGAENPAEEFVELYNTALSSVSLFDAGAPARTWRVRGEVDFVFPGGVTMASRSYLVLVSFDPAANPAALAAFRSRYSIPATVPILGPFLGRLNNAGGEIELLKPQTGAPGPAFPWVSVDRLDYGDAYPWPPEADGIGPSLQRRRPFDYGNEPTNWKAEGATAGRANVPGSGYADADGDGLPDGWEVANGLNPSNAADAGLDADGDGRTNYEEYFDGTNPKTPGSHLNGPSIVLGPQSVVVQAGTSASFGVAATGSGPLAYQWRRNGQLIPGATGSALVIGTAIPADAGDYEVSIWNGVGYAVSAPATLTVRVPPVVLLHPQSQIISSNGSATFTVGGVGTGVLRYRWQFNGADIANATGASLTITGATLSNEGDYRAFITDDFGTVVSDSARLTVKIAPRILVPPVGATNVVGSSVTFSVIASGSVPMSFQWRKGSLPLTNQILMTTNASFTLNNLQVGDSASYRVVITNLGTVATPANAQFTLLVVAPPVMSDLSRLSNGDVTMNISGPANRTYTIEYSGDLGAWSVLTSLSYTNGLVPITDTTAVGQTNRFYRARMQ